jgi:hypothetical protein
VSVVATYGAETAYLSGAPEFNPMFSGVRVARSLIFCVMFCGAFVDYIYPDELKIEDTTDTAMSA